MYIECIGDDLMNELVISIKNAYKKFGEQVVLNDVSLEIYKGRIYGIIGRNGSGKTVLFKSICGFILLDSGEITVSDKVIGKDVDMPKNVGLIIETPGFLKDYSAYWNLKFLADLNKKITNDDIKNAIRRVGLNPEDKKAVGKYSLGMRQKLGIAIALMENPELIILDEPFNALDEKSVEKVKKIIKQRAEAGALIIVSCHDREILDQIADSIYYMEEGKIIRNEKK